MGEMLDPLLGLLAFGDVLHGADGAGDLARLVEFDIGVLEDLSRFTVGPNDPVFHLVARSILVGLIDHVFDELAVVGMGHGEQFIEIGEHRSSRYPNMRLSPGLHRMILRVGSTRTMASGTSRKTASKRVFCVSSDFSVRLRSVMSSIA